MSHYNDIVHIILLSALQHLIDAAPESILDVHSKWRRLLLAEISTNMPVMIQTLPTPSQELDESFSIIRNLIANGQCGEQLKAMQESVDARSQLL